MLEAAYRGDSQFYEYIDSLDVATIKGKDDVDPLFWLVVISEAKQIEWAVSELLFAGANPHNLPSNQSFSAFIHAIRSERLEVVKAFLDAGVDPNYRYSNLESAPTPVFHALDTRNSFLLKLLLEYGVELEMRNSSMFTPLLYTRTNNWELAYLLLKAGADFRAENNQGKSILWWLKNNGYSVRPASIDWRDKVASFIIARGVDVELWEPNDFN